MSIKKRITSILLSAVILASCAAMQPAKLSKASLPSANQTEMISTQTTQKAYISGETRTADKTVASAEKSTAAVSRQSTTSSVLQKTSNYAGTYYSSLGDIEGLLARTDKNGIVSDLRSLLNSTDKKHPGYYGTGSNTLYYWFSYSDRAENDPNSGLRLFYTSQYTTSYNWNREHVWPQSLSGGLFGTTGAGCDLHHIRPTYNVDNSTRSNNPYGTVKTISKTVYSQGDTSGERIAYIGKTSNGTTAFEPRDDYKGDIARIIAYLTVHYESLYSIVENVMIGGYDTIVEWNNLDPVDDVELNRNNVAFKAQGNRNPFIDEPDLINVIWGSGATQSETWSVYQVLTNFTSSNSAKSVAKDSFYHTVLTVKDGCTFQSLKVTMGGTDITDTYYNYATGVLYIPQVTGNIVITASAQGSGTTVPDDPIEGNKKRFVKIASKDDLAVGDKIVVALSDSMIAAKSSISGSALETTSITANDTYLDTDNEEIMWTVESPSSSTSGYFKLKSVNNSMYLAGTSKTAVSLSSSGADLFLASDGSGGYVIKNADNDNRFLGTTTSSTEKTLKWYASSNLSSTSYEHDTTIYRFVETQSQEDYVYTTNDSGITLTSVNLTDSDIVVPSSIDGKTVTKIGDGAFSASSAVSITIPNTVTELGTAVFQDCLYLESVTLSSSLTNVGGYLFNNCIALQTAALPNGINSVSDGMFLGCSGLTDITLPQTITSVGSYAFGGCTALTSISIPESVSNIGVGAFSGCAQLAEATLPSALTSIPDGMFEGCSVLSQVSIPSSVKSIGNSSFKDCISITSITLPALSQMAHSNGQSQDEIPVKKAEAGLTSIADSAFEGCTSLETIKIPESVSSIGDKAFYGCEELKRAAVYNAQASVASNAFTGTSSAFKLYGHTGSTVQGLGSFTFIDLDNTSYYGITKTIKSGKMLLNMRGAHYVPETYEALAQQIIEAEALVTAAVADQYDTDIKDEEVSTAANNLRRISQ